jgi:hypothetical protein
MQTFFLKIHTEVIEDHPAWVYLNVHNFLYFHPHPDKKEWTKITMLGGDEVTIPISHVELDNMIFQLAPRARRG